MVSDEDMDHSAGGLRLLFEAHQEVQYFPGLIAPVYDIAGLDKMSFSSDPAQIIIDQSHFRVLEDQKEILVIPVEVADGDDPLNPRSFIGGRGRQADGGKGEKEKGGGR